MLEDIRYIDLTMPTAGGGGEGTSNYNDLTSKPKLNGVTISGSKTTQDYGLNKVISLGFDGTLSSGVLEFNPPTDTDSYTIIENGEYELDLHFAVAGSVSDDVEIEVVNDGEMIQFWSVNHTDTTTSIKWADFKNLAVYDDDNGYRWLFKATCRVLSNGVKAFIIYPTTNKVKTEQWTFTLSDGSTVVKNVVIQ